MMPLWTRKIEDSWLGPWRCVLLGDWFNCSRLDSIMKKLVHDLKSKCKINTNESFLKVILQGARHSFNEEACISSLMSLKKGCFIAQAGYSEEKRCETFSEVSEGAKKLSDLAVQLVYDAVNELQEEEFTIREPVILVLDYEVQVGLCWFFPSLSLWDWTWLSCQFFHLYNCDGNWPYDCWVLCKLKCKHANRKGWL